MRRRSKTATARRHKTASRKRRGIRKIVRKRSPAAISDVVQLAGERDEALEQLSAVSDVLNVISGSSTNVQPVLDAVAESAARLCDAVDTLITLRESETTQRVGARYRNRRHGPIPTSPAIGSTMPLSPGLVTSRVLLEAKPVHILNLQTETEEYPEGSKIARQNGFRTILAVPMMRDGSAIGTIGVRRAEAQLFTDRQVELVTSFAAQAVIAIENTRLLSELRESLEQQIATSEVLKVISSSRGALEPVFNAMLANATRICEAKFGVLFAYENGLFHPVALAGVPDALAEFYRQRGSFLPPPGAPLDRLLKSGSVIYTDDAESSPGAAPRLGGARSLVAVPMFKEQKLTGAIVIYRQEVRPFTEKQIDLVKSFASQAVIAIENARLLNELRQRTGDLSEALEQQTATSEVLGVISRSSGDLDPVFDAILSNATRICDAKFGGLFLSEGPGFRSVSQQGPLLDWWRHDPILDVRKHPGLPLSRVAATKAVVHVSNLAAEAVAHANDARFVALVETAGARTVLGVPMLKDDGLVGAIIIYRSDERPFTEKQIELLQNFAAQAVIAIENARLLNELRESLEQQTATSDVLKVIASSSGELEPVFTTILENAARICEAKFGAMLLREGDKYRLAALHGAPSEFAALRKPQSVFGVGPSNNVSLAMKSKKVQHVPDLRLHQSFIERDPGAVAIAELAGARTIVVVPMLKDGEPIGVISIYRQEVRPFTDKQIALVTNFAAQAVIAIENTRLLNELRQSTADLTQSLENLRTAQDRLVQTEKLASLGQLTAGIAHEIKNPLNFVNNFSAVSTEMIDELQQALKDVSLNEKKRKEITELMDTLRGNLDKVVQHGKRADSIVKNMLLHSRAGSGEHRPVDINAVVEESLNLAYHGARAEKQGFNIALEKAFDPAAGEVDMFPQEITRVLLNLISNGFYAATMRKAASGGDYEPALVAATKNLGDRVEIRIRDNGTGIPPEVKDKMFNPFFTTKPAGEGTGLGLSISHDIVVKQHGGTIEVETQPGEFTEFRIVMPRTAAAIAKSGGPA